MSEQRRELGDACVLAVVLTTHNSSVSTEDDDL